jgi:hypothetical protein
MEFSPLPGGCVCGAVRYQLTADPVTLYACHCTDCQTATGSSFALSMIVNRDAVALVRGEPELHEFRLDAGRERRGFRCSACDTTLWGAPSRFPNLLNLQPGTLDDTSWLRPAGHIWTRSAQSWFALPEDVLRYEEQPDDMLPLVRAWKSRAGRRSDP